jgi:hypothetical protein
MRRLGFPTPVVELARRAGLLAGACLLGGPIFAQATDFCLPGQSGVPACPCNNAPSTATSGCANFGPGQIGQSAKLAALGTSSVSNDTLQFQAVGENDVVLSVFYQSDSSGTPSAFGAGVTCLPANPLMLYHGMSGTGEPMGQITRPRAGIDPSVTTRSAQLGFPIAAGQPRFYMVAYRDKKAANIANCNDPTKTFNATQGLFLIWNP